MSEAMEDFTGGVAESYDLSKKVDFNLFEYMKRSNAHLSLLSCSIKVIRSYNVQLLISFMYRPLLKRLGKS